MSQRHGYQPGVPCWIDTWQADAEGAMAFYARLFGWESEDTMPPDVPGRHFMCRLRGRDVAAVAARPGAAPDVTTWNTYVWVENADQAAAAATSAGGSVVMAPFESLDGGRIVVVADPAGATIGVWQPGEHRGAQLVNEPGAWSMSQLQTPDPEGAKAFYGAVFGWHAEVFGPPEDGIALWRLPGYVGGEPHQPVPQDVVATMGPSGDQPTWMLAWVRGDRAAARRLAVSNAVVNDLWQENPPATVPQGRCETGNRGYYCGYVVSPESSGPNGDEPSGLDVTLFVKGSPSTGYLVKSAEFAG